MSESEYIKVYSGSIPLVKRMQTELEAIGITPIIKDEGESQRLAGYGSLNQGYQEIVVHEDEEQKALKIIKEVQKELGLESL